MMNRTLFRKISIVIAVLTISSMILLTFLPAGNLIY